MTELNSFQWAGSLPVWALPNAPDMANWQWKPPKPELWSLSSPPPPVPASPAPVAALEPLKMANPPEAAVIPEIRALELERDNKSLDWGPFYRELETLHVKNFKRAKARDYRAAFDSFTGRFTNSICKGELSGPATAQLYLTAYERIRIACRVFPKLDSLYIRLMFALVRGIESVKTVDRNFCIPRPLFWEIFSKQLACHEVNGPTTKLFVFAMQHTQPRHNGRALDIALSALGRYFDLWRGAEIHGTPEQWDWTEIKATSQLAAVWSARLDELLGLIASNLAKGQVRSAGFKLKVARRCANRVQRFILKKAHLMSDDQRLTEAVAEALKGKDPQHYKVLYRQATTLLGTAETTWSRAHYNWLQVMAQLPQIKTSQLKRLLALFATRGHAALSYTELCHILLLHWTSQGKLKDPALTRRLWDDTRDQSGRTTVAALALAVNKTTSPQECTAVFWDLWSILQIRIGKQTLLKQLSRLSKSHKLSSAFIKRLAWTSDDHRVALILHHLLVEHAGTMKSFWPPFWDKFAAMMSREWKYPLVDPIQIAKRLIAPEDLKNQQAGQNGEKMFHQELEQDFPNQLEMVEQQPPSEQLACYQPIPSGKETKEWAQQVERLKSGLQLLGHARQVTDRQALHYVTSFTAMLANKQGCLTARDLATLTSVITRTLDQGRCGSVQRFKWYLGVIYRHLGEAACLQVGIILKRRREMNWRAWQRGLMRLRQPAKYKEESLVGQPRQADS